MCRKKFETWDTCGISIIYKNSPLQYKTNFIGWRIADTKTSQGICGKDQNLEGIKFAWITVQWDSSTAKTIFWMAFSKIHFDYSKRFEMSSNFRNDKRKFVEISIDTLKFHSNFRT